MPNIYNIPAESKRVFFRPERILLTIQNEIFAQRWFGHKMHLDKGLTIAVNDTFTLWGSEKEVCYCTLISLIDSENKKLSSYYLPLILSYSEPAYPPAKQLYVVLKCTDKDVYLYEAEANKRYITTILKEMEKGSVLSTEKRAKVNFMRSRAFKTDGTFRVTPLSQGETTNVVYRVRSDYLDLMFKSYRMISSHYTEPQTLKMLAKNGFKNAPTILGHIALGEESYKSLGLFEDFIKNDGVLFSLFMKSVSEALVDPSKSDAAIHYTAERCKRLGAVVKEMHKALEESAEDITQEDVDHYKAFSLSMREQSQTALATVTEGPLPQMMTELSPKLDGVPAGFDALLGKKKQVTHQDLHLGQVLYDEKDVYIIDFEGEPIRQQEERAYKLPAIRDVATMLRSFDYLANMALAPHASGQLQASLALCGGAADASKDLKAKAKLLCEWKTAACNAFLEGYGASMDDPLIKLYMVEKALYEIAYEGKFRPELLSIPVTGLQDALR